MGNYLIIGASSGIGKETAALLHEDGHQVYATYFQHELPFDEAKYTTQYLDVMSEEISLDFLPETLDGLVYCPGSIYLRPFDRIKPAEFIKDYELQVIGAIKIIQAVLPRMKKSDQGSIVLFSTVAVQMGLPFHSQVSSSKGAIEGLMRALAAEYAPKIRVNCIAPSLTDTPLAAGLLNTDQKREANALRHPMKRIGCAKDIANMVIFLLSQKSSWITGQVMRVDGGMASIKS